MNRKGVKQHHYTFEELEFLRINSPRMSRKELTNVFNEKFNLNQSKQSIVAICSLKQYRSSSNGRFEKGCTSWAKGIKGKEWEKHLSKQALENVKKGQFGHGRQRKDIYEVGHEMRRNGYLIVKVSNDKNLPFNKRWKYKHTLIWEEVNGAMPKGHILIFKDGDKTNITLDNLVLISRAQNAIMASNGYHYLPVGLKTVAINTTKLFNEVRCKTNKMNF